MSLDYIVRDCADDGYNFLRAKLDSFAKSGNSHGAFNYLHSVPGLKDFEYKRREFVSFFYERYYFYRQDKKGGTL